MQFYFEIHSEITESGIINRSNRINNKLETSNLINEHALNREPVPLCPEPWGGAEGSCVKRGGEARPLV